MILIKHLMDPIESEDGVRLWVEPIGLTNDLRQWCGVHHLMSILAPGQYLWKWFQLHPDGYEFFRAKYHEQLQHRSLSAVAMQLAIAGMHQNITLLHQGDDPCQNSATALYEFLTELQAYSRPDA